MKRCSGKDHYNYCDSHTRMSDLIPLIPGFYTDDQGHLFLDMEKFLREHGMPDVPEIRYVVWEEIKDVFGDIKITEIAD